MTGPWIRLYFTPFFRSREATHWSVRDESEKTRPDSRSCTVATVERGHRRQKTRRFSAFRVLDPAYLEKGLDTVPIVAGAKRLRSTSFYPE